jgi:effector-binding domain-containing protein
MSYEIERKTIAAQPIAYGEGSGSAGEIPSLLGEILPRAMKHIQASGGKPAGPPFTHYLKMGETIEFQAGIPLQKSIDGGDGIKTGELPGGEVLRTVHIGPYDELNKAYAAMAQYVEEHGLNAGDTMWEYYWTDPSEEPNPENWKTELFLPLNS